MKRFGIVPVFLGLLLLLSTSCGNESELLAPEAFDITPLPLSVWTETLGDPDIPIAPGTGIVQGGTGMLTQPGYIDIDVPGTAINQVLIYWSGGTVEAPYFGDNEIKVDGTPVSGTLVGGPAFFWDPYRFTTYRADITAMGLVQLGSNNLEITEMDYVGGALNENDGVGILVIYQDGTEPDADIRVREGLDLAFFDFPEPRRSTIPQTFTFDAASTARTADLVIFSGSVGENRPNEIEVTVDGSVEVFVNELGSFDGPLWDALTLEIDIPTGATSLTVELISTDSYDPLGASMTWVACALSVPPEEEQEGCTRTIGYWKNHDGSKSQPDMITDLLPQWLGTPGGTKSMFVDNVDMADDILEMKTYGKNNNGVTKLYAQLLAAKLNVENGASDDDISDAVLAADAFLADYDWQDWEDGNLTDEQMEMVLAWKDTFDDYNNGVIGPGHCEEEPEDRDSPMFGYTN